MPIKIIYEISSMEISNLSYYILMNNNKKKMYSLTVDVCVYEEFKNVSRCRRPDVCS